MSHFRLTKQAQTDLINIRKFTVAEWGEAQSNKYLSGLSNTIELLAQSPKLGKHRPDVSNETFSHPYNSHAIYYLIHNKTIVIFGILHQKMVPTNHLNLSKN